MLWLPSPLCRAAGSGSGYHAAPISALACVLKQIAEKQGAPAEEAADAEKASELNSVSLS